MQLSFASYNIRKAVGLDRRRDPDRILTILHEIDADVIALQEADRRFGSRASVLPPAAILEHTPYRPVPLARGRESIGWHGNALLVRRDIEILGSSVIDLPTLEPRGAISADLSVQGRRLRVVGMHLDLSGLRRRKQVKSILSHVADREPGSSAVLMGDFNQWTHRSGCFREFDGDWQVLAPGSSFPSRRPVARFDRIVASAEWQVIDACIHHSALAAKGSDHLPVKATLQLPIF